ncbi:MULTISPECIES: LON peptidase substrate-binding domain-containing protein [Zhongshania]|jgi:Lon protease-like protein|uniref:LON peptidase substrate-binding domain-containing protein n=1 Tax=Zhongshania aquimaris TaxID=2857107 RepID=A0ABS6VWC2_9GAMM|nr:MULTISPECIES: LON peptidase substrate-binding domain-containing protein [Zhongshania]MBQ0796120.1 LON peptidase substrate-binding domain-containing protein [Zhongshania sp.]MBW2942314.1 LON peptidase substrate-binding domain-containing protein [Zhongshania aquimaris]
MANAAALKGTELPLFPLRTVLFPGGRMGLRIFERRYLDLVRDTLRAQGSFGIVWMPEGGKEVMSPGEKPASLALIGTEARIADWDQLPDGLLGVVVEGGRRFRINDAKQAPSGLYIGDVEWLPELEDRQLPPRSEELHDLLKQLGEHPHVQRLGMEIDVDEAGALANRLAQLLPLPEEQSYQLLSIDEPLLRLDALHDVLDGLAS